MDKIFHSQKHIPNGNGKIFPIYSKVVKIGILRKIGGGTKINGQNRKRTIYRA